MIQFEGIAAGADAIRLFVLTNLDTLPPEMVAKIEPHTGTGSSPVDLGVAFTESVYANQGKKGVTKEARKLAQAFAVLTDQFGFHGKLNGRAAKIAGALARVNGEPGTWPKAADDPAPADGYDITVKPAAPDPAPPPPPPVNPPAA